MMDKNDFKKNGLIRVRFETPEEKTEIIRILEDQLGFCVSNTLKHMKEKATYDTRTFYIDLRRKEYTYSIQPLIGAAMCSCGVRFYAASEFFKVAELGFKKFPRYLAFHVPHDGERFPEELMSSVCVPKEVFMAYHTAMRDTDIGKIVPAAYRTRTIYFHFDISRLLCDVERFIGPEETMEKYGMGFCYERVFDGTVIKQMTKELKMKAMEYYVEHHKRLNRICEQNKRVLIFDLHSFSDEIVPYDLWRDGVMSPDICIGADRKFTPPALIEIVRKHFENDGYSIGVNYPYEGTYIPESILNSKNTCDCISIMLEVNKRIYLDQNDHSDQGKLRELRNIVQRIINDCVEL